MENSMNSKSRSSPTVSLYEEVADDDETPEESSWTMYLEDFSNSSNGNYNRCFSSSSDMNYYQASSLVSDAADSAAATRHVLGACLDHHHRPKSCNKRLSLIKRRMIKGSAGVVNDDLEDTATSPANSPKVCNLVNEFDKNLKHKDDISQELKGSVSGQIDERNDELGFLWYRK